MNRDDLTMHEMGLAELSAVVVEACGIWIDNPTPDDKLSDLGLDGIEVLACVGLIESRYDIEFPADLLPALESVDDLLHYTAVKRSQR